MKYTEPHSAIAMLIMATLPAIMAFLWLNSCNTEKIPANPESTATLQEIAPVLAARDPIFASANITITGGNESVSRRMPDYAEAGSAELHKIPLPLTEHMLKSVHLSLQVRLANKTDEIRFRLPGFEENSPEFLLQAEIRDGKYAYRLCYREECYPPIP